MRQTIPILGLCAILALSGCKSEEDEAREILADALQRYAVMQNDTTPTEERLTAGRSVAEALEKIVADYGTTDLGLQIAAGGKVGEFTSAELAQQIASLEDLRSFELCDEQPTASCVVDHLVADLGYDDREGLFQDINPSETLMLAMATSETETAYHFLAQGPKANQNALALATAPLGSLTPDLVDKAFEEWDRDTADMASALAVYRIIGGEDVPILRDIAGRSETGGGLLRVLDDPDGIEGFVDNLMELDGAGGFNHQAFDEATRMLVTFGYLDGPLGAFAPFTMKFGAEEVLDKMMPEFGGDAEYMVMEFGPEMALPKIASIISDTDTDPRDLGTALRQAAIYMPQDDLRQAFDGLRDREVKKWGDERLYLPLVSVAAKGDRGLFDQVAQILALPDFQNELEDIWQTGTDLAAGKAAQVVLEDDGLLLAAVELASLRLSAEVLESFLRDAIDKVGSPGNEDLVPITRDMIASGALQCGMPGVLVQMEASPKELQRRLLRQCDRTRLGTRADDLSDADFSYYVSHAGQSGWVDGEILVETARTVPARAYELVQAMPEGDERIFLTALLAMILAQE